MTETDTGTFTVAVFQDVAWARRAIEALRGHGFAPEHLTVLGKASPELSTLCEEALGAVPEQLELRALGAAVGRGSLLPVLQGSDKALATLGLGGTFRRAGFQPHDGHIFETLAGRGGVLVAVRDERRAADALATMHAYGGGNAAIGAWSGRV